VTADKFAIKCWNPRASWPQGVVGEREFTFELLHTLPLTSLLLPSDPYRQMLDKHVELWGTAEVDGWDYQNGGEKVVSKWWFLHKLSLFLVPEGSLLCVQIEGDTWEEVGTIAVVDAHTLDVVQANLLSQDVFPDRIEPTHLFGEYMCDSHGWWSHNPNGTGEAHTSTHIVVHNLRNKTHVVHTVLDRDGAFGEHGWEDTSADFDEQTGCLRVAKMAGGLAGLLVELTDGSVTFFEWAEDLRPKVSVDTKQIIQSVCSQRARCRYDSRNSLVNSR
jgi:hypothetical protein